MNEKTDLDASGEVVRDGAANPAQAVFYCSFMHAHKSWRSCPVPYDTATLPDGIDFSHPSPIHMTMF